MQDRSPGATRPDPPDADAWARAAEAARRAALLGADVERDRYLACLSRLEQAQRPAPTTFTPAEDLAAAMREASDELLPTLAEVDVLLASAQAQDNAWFEAEDAHRRRQRLLWWKTARPSERRRVSRCARAELQRAKRDRLNPWRADVRERVGDIVYTAMVDLTDNEIVGLVRELEPVGAVEVTAPMRDDPRPRGRRDQATRPSARSGDSGSEPDEPEPPGQGRLCSAPWCTHPAYGRKTYCDTEPCKRRRGRERQHKSRVAAAARRTDDDLEAARLAKYVGHGAFAVGLAPPAGVEPEPHSLSYLWKYGLAQGEDPGELKAINWFRRGMAQGVVA